MENYARHEQDYSVRDGGGGRKNGYEIALLIY
jgi:hypothetical protein